MSDLQQQIAENVDAVRRRIAEAAGRSGRRADEITLVAVTKYVGVDECRALAAAGCTELGESRPQQLWQKTAALADLPVNWHMIGHLQRNKARQTLPSVAMIHSVDSRRLLRAIDRTAGELGLCLPILLEVNISGEEAKHGFEPGEIQPLLGELPSLTHVSVRGLMCMASWGGGHHEARADFAKLRRMREQLEPNCPTGVVLDELSMGMSGDFDVAIEEGSTMVRVGSALYEGIDR
jgi:pyridoxal phosphate enzyme (YggS family)